MKQALLNWLKANGGRHAEALVIAAVLVFGGRMWLQEHDARLKTDATVKTAEENVKSLTAKQADVQKTTETKVIVLREQAAAVDTPAKALAALPQTAPEIQPEALPDAPDRVSVLSEPLFQDLNQAAQAKAELAGCEDSLALQKRITAEKDKEVKAEKQKPSFLHRLGRGAKIIGCSAAGAAIGGLTKSAEGAAIGGAAGAGICQMF